MARKRRRADFVKEPHRRELGIRRQPGGKNRLIRIKLRGARRRATRGGRALIAGQLTRDDPVVHHAPAHAETLGDGEFREAIIEKSVAVPRRYPIRTRCLASEQEGGECANGPDGCSLLGSEHPPAGGAPSVQFSPVNLRNFTPVLTYRSDDDRGGSPWYQPDLFGMPARAENAQATRSAPPPLCGVWI